MKLKHWAVALLVLIANPTVSPASSGRAQTPPTIPPGFQVTLYSSIGGNATSLAFGPDTRNLSRTRLYVARFSDGTVVTVDDQGGVGSPPTIFASGFRRPLGVVVAADGTLFVADSEARRDGVFGNRPYGRVWRGAGTTGERDGGVKEDGLQEIPHRPPH